MTYTISIDGTFYNLIEGSNITYTVNKFTENLFIKSPLTEQGYTLRNLFLALDDTQNQLIDYYVNNIKVVSMEKTTAAICSYQINTEEDQITEIVIIDKKNEV